MLLLFTSHILLLILLFAAVFIGVFLFLVLKYKVKIFKREINAQAKQIAKFSEENKEFRSRLNELVDEKTKDFHEQMKQNEHLIAERKIALKKAKDANFLKNAFLANMSHEIRTPLNSIIGFSDLLQTEFSLLEEKNLFEYAQAISESSDRLLILLDNLIDISRVDANDYEVNNQSSNINTSIEKIYELYLIKAQGKHLKMNLVPTEVPDSQFDASILERIISLVLENAIKYTEIGYININSAFKPNSNQLLIRIKDTGVGIEEKFLSEVFSPFRQESLGYSKSHQGAGLGLPLAKKLIKLIDGDIQIKSKKQEGTSVSIIIPYLKGDSKVYIPKENIQTKQESIQLKTNKLPRILVVEDDKMNRLVFKKMLGNISELIMCIDGDEALSTVAEEFEKNNSFDLVLMDINLPAPWDGIGVMKEMKRKFKQSHSIPFIAQTAYAMSGDREKMLREGFDDYIAKPIDKAELYHIIEDYIKNETL